MMPSLQQVRELAADRFVRNLGSMGGAQLAIRISRLVTTVILARLLSPTDYGLAAIVLTVYELVALFTRNGISAKVVQARPDEVASVAQTAYTLTWIVCGALVVAQALLAMPIAWFYGKPDLALPIALMGLIYLATPLCNIQGAFIQREGRVGRIALTGAIQVITDNLLTAVLAACGLGMWAIILPKLLVAPIWVIGLRSGHAWRPARGWSLAGWRDIARFSRSVIGVEAMTTLQANIDNLIVGSMLGVEALGLYYVAFNAGLGITLGLVNAFGVAVYPHLCEVRSEPAALTQRYRRSTRTLGMLIVPLILLQVVLAPIYVPIVFGAHWTPAIPVLMLICLSALPRPFSVACSQLLKAVGRPDIELRWQSALTVMLVAGLLIGATQGIVGVAVAVLVVQAVMLTAYVLVAPRPFLRARNTSDVVLAAGDVTFEVVSDPERLRALQPEWDALWTRADAPYLSQSFAWCHTGWLTTCAPRGRSLCVVVARQSGRAVLIWPLTSRRRFGFTTATSLGAESTEYDPILVEHGADAAGLVRAAWTFVRTKSGFATVKLPFVRAGSPTQRMLHSLAPYHAAHTLPAPMTTFTANEPFETYWRSRSSNLRNGLKRRRRKLGEQGKIVSEWIDDPAEFALLLDWALVHKLAWMKATGMDNDFLATPEYRAFLVAMFAQRASPNRLAMMVMRLGDQPLTVKIGCIDGVRYEGFLSVYDPAWSEFSPGQLILADCLEWCHAHGLYYDFRIGDERYKLDWATATPATTTYTVATGIRGVLLIEADACAERLRSLTDRLRRRLPEHWRARIKAIASRLKPSPVLQEI